MEHVKKSIKTSLAFLLIALLVLIALETATAVLVASDSVDYKNRYSLYNVSNISVSLFRGPIRNDSLTYPNATHKGAVHSRTCPSGFFDALGTDGVFTCGSAEQEPSHKSQQEQA